MLKILRLISSVIIPDYVAELYEQAFPPEERRNLPEQQLLLNEGALRLALLEMDGVNAGFVFYWELTGFVFIEHFAISPALRGCGVGSATMRLIEQAHPQIVLEVEPPHAEEAVRRISFYERLGFNAYRFPYLQPPYRPGGKPLSMLLMQKGMSPEEHTFTKTYSEIYLKVYGCR